MKHCFLRMLALMMLGCFLLLASCTGKNAPPDVTGTDAPDDATQSGEPDIPDTPQTYTFARDDMEKFKIVYADGSSADVIESANNLAALIRKNCGSEPLVTTDFLVEGSSTFCEYEYEILIGATNREESDALTVSLRLHDFGYSCTEKKILISARNDYDLKRAVDDFTVQIVMGKKNDPMFYSAEWNTVKTEPYPVQTLTVNGTDISAWSIIYPVRSTAFERELANALQDGIAERTGYILPIFPDSADTGDAPVFLIGSTSRTETGMFAAEQTGYLAGSGKQLTLGGQSAWANATAVQEFLNQITNRAEAGSCALTFAETQTVPVNHNSFSGMSFNILTADMSSARTDRVVTTVMRYLPDTLGVQEANPTWMTQLKSRLGSLYASAGTGTGGGANGEHVAIFYNKEKFNLVEQNTYWLTETPEINSIMPGTEYSRVYTYVILEEKTTGQKLMHLNVHLDTAGSSIRTAEVRLLMDFLKKYNNIPVILTGDLNATDDTVEIQTLFANCFADPRTTLDMQSTTVTFYLHNTNIDYLLYTGDCIVPTLYHVEGNRINGDYASDHNAVYVEFEIRVDGEIDHGWHRIHSGNPSDWLEVDEDSDPDESMGDIHFIP